MADDKNGKGKDNSTQSQNTEPDPPVRDAVKSKQPNGSPQRSNEKTVPKKSNQDKEKKK